MKKYLSIIFLQRRFKLLIKIKDNFNNELNSIYDIMYGLMNRIHENFKNEIIPQHKYNSQLNKLYAILDIYKTLDKSLIIRDLFSLKIKNIRKNIDKIKDEIRTISSDCGAKNVYDIITLNFSSSISYILNNKELKNNVNLICFFNKIFVPTSYKIYKDITTKLKKKKDLTLYNPNISEDISVYDLYNINNIQNPLCKPLKKNISSMIEHINGTRLYIHLK